MSIEEILEFLDAVGENDSELDLKKNYLQQIAYRDQHMDARYIT